MPNWIYQNLLNEQVNKLINSFTLSEEIFNKVVSPEERKLIHPGEFGTYRELIAAEFIRFFIPGYLSITNGFIITPQNEVSTQCDIIIYDKDNTPLVQNSNKDKFIPIESVVAVGEIKSNPKASNLKSALKKLSKVKMFRSQIDSRTKFSKRPGRYVNDAFSTDTNIDDQIVTFLICKKFDFKTENDFEFNLYTEEVPPEYRHNMILSLESGFVGYEMESYRRSNPSMLDPRGKITMSYVPKIHELVLNPIYMKSNERGDHINMFANYLYQATQNTAVLSVDIVNYMGKYFDEESE